MRCPDCGSQYSGSDSSGGHCRQCCTTFSSQTAFDSHRYGSFESRQCRSHDWMLEHGWRLTLRGWTNSKPMQETAIRRLSGE